MDVSGRNWLGLSSDLLQRKEPTVFVGAMTPRKPEQCYVFIERSAYSCSSLTAAVDYCYKMFQVLQLDYPAQAAVIWDFFGRLIYGIRTKEVSAYQKKSTHQTNATKHSVQTSLAPKKPTPAVKNKRAQGSQLKEKPAHQTKMTAQLQAFRIPRKVSADPPHVSKPAQSQIQVQLQAPQPQHSRPSLSCTTGEIRQVRDTSDTPSKKQKTGKVVGKATSSTVHKAGTSSHPSTIKVSSKMTGNVFFLKQDVEERKKQDRQ
ncbi:uncharacterized protein LOC115927760 [Strongylocentrotus purpuratus]|uniref:Uncharacterized protein n=1 Tax=Strongylocentrotus purpuratus TaxID=7668 RepID=A0A7M7T2V4_STRPU|nr:uncharacterized protein LOC115927760 [Strongylocentrotus purpuratus]